MPSFLDLRSRSVSGEQTIIHEAGHLTHCDAEENTIGVTIGSPWCLSMFVVDANSMELNPAFRTNCGFTPKQLRPQFQQTVCVVGSRRAAPAAPAKPAARGPATAAGLAAIA